jgi:hypothetical protein
MGNKQFNIVVDRDVRAFFADASIKGHGGFQSLSRTLSTQLRKSTILKLTADEFGRVVRYANSYGNGGFQTRLRAIVAAWVHQNLNTVVKG